MLFERRELSAPIKKFKQSLRVCQFAKNFTLHVQFLRLRDQAKYFKAKQHKRDMSNGTVKGRKVKLVKLCDSSSFVCITLAAAMIDLIWIVAFGISSSSG